MPLRAQTNSLLAGAAHRALKSPCTAASSRRPLPPDAPSDPAPMRLDELPDELIGHALAQLALTEAVPGASPTFRAGVDAIVLGPASAAARLCGRVGAVSRRWRALAGAVEPWSRLKSMERGNDLNWEVFREQVGEKGAVCWAASSTSREEGKADEWKSVMMPGGDRTVVLVRKCNEEGVSYDIVRWVGCLQSIHHPCIAALQVLRASHDVDEGSRMHAGFEHVDTSLQKIVYGTLERTSHTVIGRPLPSLMLRSFMYQLLSALACCHARGISHGNLAPYRVLAVELDAEKDQYLLKLADFGFSPPAAALCNEELPIRPSRASPELSQDHKYKRYGPANDVWALGTVFAEMACGNRDPTVYMMIQDLEAVDDALVEANLSMMSSNARDLLRKMLRSEPQDRITAANALCHPYFEGIHDECAVVGRYLPETMAPPAQFLKVRATEQWRPLHDFMAEQPDLNARMWTILYDWLSVVSFKFKFVPRSLQLACNFMLRYMSLVHVQRKSLQLVGIGALCLACKHEEVMIPNMGDFIYICDAAYDVHELMAMEVDILNTLQLKLHVPTCHDILLPILVEIGEAPQYPDASQQSMLRSWCECLTLLGQANYNVVLHDPSSLARCVGTLGAILSRGMVPNVAQEDGSMGEGMIGGRLRDRVCYLKSANDWDCFHNLIKGIEAAVKDSREMLVKCYPNFVAMKPLQAVLDDVAQEPKRQANHLKAKVMALPESREQAFLLRLCAPVQDVRPALDKFYSVEVSRELNAYLAPDEIPREKTAYMRMGTGVNAEYNITSVTCAIGRQLLHEHSVASKSAASRSSSTHH